MTEPSQLWWSAVELAAAKLPDLPGTKQGVGQLAKREGWDRQPGKVRRRKGKGGGLEYHWTVLPLRARMALVKKADAPAPKPDTKATRDDAWAAYEAVTDSAKAKARMRFDALEKVDALVAAGLTRYLATEEVARDIGMSSRSIWNWHDWVEGVAHADRLAYLVDRHQLVKRKKRTAPVDPEFFALIKRWYLSPEQRDMTACYDWAVEVAENEGIPIPPLHRVRAHYKQAVSKPVEIFWRKGADALKRFYPAQTRDKNAMVPLECVQGDYHKFDVFVAWPGERLPIRVQTVFFSDVYSNKVLAWRYSVTANSHTVQLCIGDLIEKYGIPQSALLDNGREFAAKVITGGTPTRFRFKVTDEDIPGLLPLMGVKVHWATPYSGQSKPIERTFRDFCARIAKHPEFEGAYTGNKPDAQPENYGERAIPLDQFKAVVDREIERWNARPDRRTDVAMGRSFNDVFNEGYKTAPIRKPTDEQRRLWLLRAEGVRANSKNGEINLFGSRFWSEWAYRIAGQKVVARFDPDNLHAGLEIYDLTGEYLGGLACLVAGAFLSVDDARTHNRKRTSYEKAVKAAAQAERDLDGAAAAARLRAAGQEVDPDALPEADVVQMPVPHKSAPKPGRRARAEAIDREAEHQLEAQVTRLAERRAAAARDRTPEEEFERAMELEAMERDGMRLTPDQAEWLKEYQQSAEYRGRMRVARALGPET
jgi:hypothetical protein